MTSPWTPPAPSALDDTPWPEQLTARVIEPGADDDRMHGYAVLGDLRRHYRYSDLLYLATRGALPSSVQSSLFELALFSLATPNVGDAQVHIAVLARLSGAPIGSALGAGMIAAAAQAQAMVEHHTDLIDWLRDRKSEVPPTYVGETRVWVQTLREAVVESGGDPDLIGPQFTPDAARICLLWLAGLDRAEQMVTAIMAARLGAIAAEATATGPHDLGAYPVKLPPFHYVEDGTDRR